MGHPGRQHDTQAGQLRVDLRLARHDVSDEIVIDAEPDEVYRALVDEMDGRTHLWEPVRTNVL